MSTLPVPRRFLRAAFWVAGLLALAPLPTWACRVCRPRVQATIHAPDYTQNILLVLLPVALVLLLGIGLFFAGTITRRFTTSFNSHG